MRMFRAVLTALLAAVLGLGASVSLPAGAASLPKRVITEQPPGDHPVTFNAFKLKGKVEEPVSVVQPDGAVTQTYVPYAGQKVHLQKKACKACGWKTVKKLETDDAGTYKTRIFAPREGRWKWRVKVKGSNGYATTKGKVWTLYFR